MEAEGAAFRLGVGGEGGCFCTLEAKSLRRWVGARSGGACGRRGAGVVVVVWWWWCRFCLGVFQTTPSPQHPFSPPSMQSLVAFFLVENCSHPLPRVFPNVLWLLVFFLIKNCPPAPLPLSSPRPPRVTPRNRP